MKVSELPFAKEVVTLKPNELVGDALKLFQDNKVGSVVIVDDQNLVLGIFTERDYVMKIAGGQSGMDSDAIEKHMTPQPKSVRLHEPVMKAAISMRMGNFRHVIIVDEDNSLRGMISVKDVLDWMMDTMTALGEK